jgi:uncharacterized protein (TIGR00255 family)
MPIRSMTAFAQAKGQLAIAPSATPAEAAGPVHSLPSDPLPGNALRAVPPLGFVLSLKTVNHRFLDLHLRLPAGWEALEIELRRLLKNKLARGHIELTLHLERAGEDNFCLNRQIVGGYIYAFRAAAAEYGLAENPDLNVILRMPGALETGCPEPEPALRAAILGKVEELLLQLNRMRDHEGGEIEVELRARMAEVQRAADGVKRFRGHLVRAYAERLKTRMQELVVTPLEPERVLQEAALLADRSEIQEELIRLEAHVKHFLSLLASGGEVGKKLDFLLQEMNREANTLLSKTSGLAGEALEITGLGLSMKAEIEKAREQVQNIE